MFERKILFTEDGSQSIYVEELNEHYHSIHGAMQESQHIFINHGLKLCKRGRFLFSKLVLERDLMLY